MEKEDRVKRRFLAETSLFLCTNHAACQPEKQVKWQKGGDRTNEQISILDKGKKERSCKCFCVTCRFYEVCRNDGAEPDRTDITKINSGAAGLDMVK